MLETSPVHGSADQLAATRVFVRFKESKLTPTYHDLGDSLGSVLILVGYNQHDSMYCLTYINAANTILKRIAYSRESILELSLMESVCRIIPTPSKPPLKVV